MEPCLKATAEHVRQALHQMGVAADIGGSDFASYIRRIYTERVFDLDVQTLVNGVDPTDGVQRAY
ncbi:hypothetical protein GCM10007301_30100 [Azorhizobium oxalatiphilum]|uniref:Uncharacterized protein n=1 Tax=Azorhizobium oxalatiphilum TaxID=980631 RepID=A0A917C1Y5_9HYPH|nr:hypothetical protein [Azorhizobium oxalatiphilum]GGF68394.1 hypothetical protein GCM10007301_30100 [Azorhizobium oxalatiphilum]